MRFIKGSRPTSKRELGTPVEFAAANSPLTITKACNDHSKQIAKPISPEGNGGVAYV